MASKQVKRKPLKLRLSEKTRKHFISMIKGTGKKTDPDIKMGPHPKYWQ